MSPTPLRLAVIGAGVMGRSHIERIRTSGECVLAAVCDPDLALATQAAGDCPVHAGLPELLRRERIDGVIIATPNARHRECGVLCARAGVPMLVEKPIAATTADGGALVEAAARHGVPLLVGQHRRHSAYVQRARRVIERGELGRLVSFTALWFVRKPDDYYEVGWRTRPGGGPVLTNLIHEIDLIRHLGGEIESVYAAGSSAARGLPVEDSVAITLRLAGGALGSIAASDAAVSPWSYELTTHENPLYTRTDLNCYFLARHRGVAGVPAADAVAPPRRDRVAAPAVGNAPASGPGGPGRRPARPLLRRDPRPGGAARVRPGRTGDPGRHRGGAAIRRRRPPGQARVLGGPDRHGVMGAGCRAAATTTRWSPRRRRPKQPPVSSLQVRRR